VPSLKDCWSSGVVRFIR